MKPRPHPSAAPEAADDTLTVPGGKEHPGVLSTPLRVVGLVIYAVLGALSAAFDVLLVPSRIGSTLVPIAVVLAVAGNILLPTLAASFTRTAAGSVAPVVSWIVVLATLASARPEGDVLLPGSGTVQYVSYGVMVGGLLSGLVTLGVLASGGPRGSDTPDSGARPGSPRQPSGGRTR